MPSGVRGARDRHPARGQQMLHDIGHPAARGEKVYDVTFENVQAGERTRHLFRLANFHGGIVVGTGDLSELALGWSTYGVGDHMSHYNVNASVPKTLIQLLLRWAIDTEPVGRRGERRLHGARHRISPELDPRRGSGADGPGADSESDRRAVRAPGLLPLPRAPVRLPPQQGRVPGASRLARPRVGPLARPDPPSAATSTRSPRSSTGSRFSWTGSSGPASSSARRSRTRRRSDPAARSRRGATGERRATRAQSLGFAS